MATLTAGTKLTTSLTALQWNPAGVSVADLATINAAIRNPVTGAYGASAARGPYIENGILYLPNRQSSVPADMSMIVLQPGDWIMVDGAGWPIVVPNAIFSTSWQHS